MKTLQNLVKVYITIACLALIWTAYTCYSGYADDMKIQNTLERTQVFHKA